MNWQSLPPHSRTWIYQADRFFTEKEEQEIKKQGNDFIKSWSSHGAKLQAGIEVFDKLFVVVFVDEQQAAASGCSIDKSVVFVKSLESQMGISLTDRMRVAFVRNGGIETSVLGELTKLAAENRINESTLIYDNLVSTKEEFEKTRIKPIAESWHKRFM